MSAVAPSVASNRTDTPATVARFADGLLSHELPLLSDDRRREAIEFIGRRVRVLPSLTRFGVLLIGRFLDVLGIVVGHANVRRLVTTMPIPLLAEYPRLVRSLGFAYVWETWPDTTVDGGRPAG
ncbi:MAG: hypothetical protein ABJH68_01725 [Ilumatobacter sp.]|uniref:hypothetical protein n=1 Tax=Ilumatobacter sp. TaxID=1967498 RepID=UPI003296A72E